MRITLSSIILLYSVGIAYSQPVCKEYKDDYIPKNLNSALEYLNCVWPEEDKEQFKNKNEDDAVTELHFGTGLGIRNGWDLWKGKNRISRFFKRKGVSHPEDISSIILTSFHRRLNNRPLNLDEQISYYKKYWNDLKLEQERLKQEFKELEIGETIKIPLSGSTGWRFDGTDRTTLHSYSYTVENSRDFDCIVEGSVLSKKKRKKDYNLTIKITILSSCHYKNPIYQRKEVAVGELMEINMMVNKVIIE